MRLLLSLFAGVCLAQDRAGAPVPRSSFAADYLKAVSLALRQDPLYASRLLGQFHSNLDRVLPLKTPQEVVSQLQDRVTGSGKEALTPAQLKRDLGSSPMDAGRASALLLANALMRPEQFQEVVSGLEGLKPGLGARLSDALKEADSREASPSFLRLLNAVGRKTIPRPEMLTYDSKGGLDLVFDGKGLGASGDVYEPSAVETEYTGYGQDGKPRASGLKPSTRKR